MRFVKADRQRTLDVSPFSLVLREYGNDFWRNRLRKLCYTCRNTIPALLIYARTTYTTYMYRRDIYLICRAKRRKLRFITVIRLRSLVRPACPGSNSGNSGTAPIGDTWAIPNTVTHLSHSAHEAKLEARDTGPCGCGFIRVRSSARVAIYGFTLLNLQIEPSLGMVTSRIG